MIKIEFPADRNDIALAIGRALLEMGGSEGGMGTRPAVVRIAEGVSDLQAYDRMPSDSEAHDLAAAASVPADQLQQPASENSDPAADLKVDRDQKGVEFNPDYCGKAAKPFYESGTRLGQWKKRKGVADEDYDNWYASQVEPQATEAAEPEPADTSAAFNPAPQQEQQAAPAGFANFGELITWVSEMQAAGRLTAQDVQDAYTACGVTVADVAVPGGEAHLAPLHQFLEGRAEA